MLTPQTGKVYIVKHQDGLKKMEFLRESKHLNPLNFRTLTHFIFKNLVTGREVVIKSRVKIKREVELPSKEVKGVGLIGETAL